MSLLDVYRSPARELLTTLTGTAAPEWRVCSEEATEELSSIAPVCTDEEHDPDDAFVYPCCPEPVIECHSGAMAEYFAALLNSDREKS